MRRPPELHERFADWLASRPPGIPDEPPRDLALHAAACDQCLRKATALDGLAGIAIGAIGPPIVPVARERPARIGSLGRYAVAGATLALVGGAVAVGSSLVGDAPPSDVAQAESFGEGVLAGVPTVHLSASPLPTPTPTATPTERPSRSPEASEEPSEEPVPIPTAAAPPTARPLPTQNPTAAPTALPIPAPTASPTIIATAAPTASPAPPTPTLAPSPTPTAAPTAEPTAPPTASPAAP